MSSALPDLPGRLVPKLWTVLREGIPRAQLARDALSGVIVAVVALPLAIAFAIASGVRPEQGLATAIVAGFLISALGGSRVQIGGPTGAALFFGAASKFKDAVRRVERPPPVLILRMRAVLAIDATGLRALEDLLDKTLRDGTQLVLSGVHAQPLVALERSGLLARIGEDNVHGNIREALARARTLVGAPAPA